MQGGEESDNGGWRGFEGRVLGGRFALTRSCCEEGETVKGSEGVSGRGRREGRAGGGRGEGLRGKACSHLCNEGEIGRRGGGKGVF